MIIIIIISDKAIQIVAYWEGKGIWRPIQQEADYYYYIGI